VASVRAVVEHPASAFGLDVQVGRVRAAGVHRGFGGPARNRASSKVGDFVASGRIQECHEAVAGSGKGVPAREGASPGVVATVWDEHDERRVLGVEVVAHAGLVGVTRIFTWN